MATTMDELIGLDTISSAGSSMRRSLRWLVVAIITTSVMLVGPGIGTARPQGGQAPAGCHRLFWMKDGIRFARRVYHGSPTRWQLKHLRRMDRCQHNVHATRYLAKVIARQRAAWHRRRAYAASHPWGTAVASWYNDAGQTASGTHYTYGVADCGDTTHAPDGTSIPCAFGTRIEFCYHGCVTATVDDRGPYVGGSRQFDLDETTAQAIGFGGVDTVRWRTV